MRTRASLIGVLSAALLLLSFAPMIVDAQAESPLKVTITADPEGDVTTYKITLENLGDQAIGNIFVAGDVPAGTQLRAVVDTPQGATSLGLQGAGGDFPTAAWLVESLAQKTTIGPFTYQVSAPQDMTLQVKAFVHATSPSDVSLTTEPTLRFPLVVSNRPFAFLPEALPNGKGAVTVSPGEGADRVVVQVQGLLPNVGLSAFFTEKPLNPFGVVQYVADIETDGQGNGSVEFKAIAREAFSIDITPQPDGSLRLPRTELHHIGIWIADPSQDDSLFAGRTLPANIPPTGPVTPFDGDGQAGPQVLTTSLNPDAPGPLQK